MPDYFDRLLARHVPAGPPDGSGAVLVRPRLPGPYERIEALRAGAPEPDAFAPVLPGTPRRADDRDIGQIRYEREVRTDRHTVVRTEAPSRDEPGRPATPAPAPLLRPAERTAPAPRPAPPDTPRRTRWTPRTPDPDAVPRTAAAVRTPLGAAAAPPLLAPEPRPREADTAAARDAARSAGGRRRSRTAEQVVHVQIGRLEVSAAGVSGARRADGGQPRRGDRPAPALSLQDYLSRGERRS